MLYKNNKFWVKSGVDHTLNFLKFIGQESGNIDLEWIFTELFVKNNRGITLGDRRFKAFVLAWVEIKSIIELWYQRYKKTKKWFIKIRDLENLYLTLDCNGTYWKFFQEESFERKEFLNDINSLLKNLLKAKNLKAALEPILIFCHKQYLEGTFGRYTSQFIWILLQTFLIFKDYSPIIAMVDKNSQTLWLFPLINMLYNELSTISISKWKKSYYFKKIYDFCYNNSTQYSLQLKKII
ncbi:hypothetical protein SLITO_v1c02890 [Spiroplasma litorale]|uniref:Uncharacterized protein n=1 Tax=Spiroplasma litorale TaxID=216942 RepID=A0A0K1W0U5_9MOLU|nr:hypothetical protein [Spiroplasma litorale]AKX33944.1 hypothetical protein SLITO_v1c02890 [Spiroplasma litorale]